MSRPDPESASILQPVDDLLPPEDAAHWFARMQSGEVTEADRAAFAAWCAADPANAREYRRLSALWQATLAVPAPKLRAMMASSPRLSRGSRRRQWLGLAAAGSVAGVAGMLTLGSQLARPVEVLELTTRRGERRQSTLPDGSIIHLNSETRAVARFDEAVRAVELHRGEAYFDVRQDALRPFRVEAGLGRVNVTGTRFNVRRDEDALQVSVEEGAVQVTAGPWWRGSERRLLAGQQIVAYPDDSLSAVARVDVGDVVAWQRGKIIFNNVPLATVVLEMNRYLAVPAQLGAPHLGPYRVSGVFSVDDPEALIVALPAIAPVRIHRQADGRTHILPI